MDKRVEDAIKTLSRVTVPVEAPAPVISRKRTRLERLLDEHVHREESTPLTRRTPRHDPWRNDQYLERLSTFARARDWFAKPEAVSPAQCARYGWRLSRCNVLVCPTCGAHASFSASFAGGQSSGDVEAQARAFAGTLLTAHGSKCPWRTLQCAMDFARLPALPPHTLLAGFALRVAQMPEFMHGIPGGEVSLLGERTAERAAATLTAACNGSSSGRGVNSAIDVAATLLADLAQRLDSPGSPAHNLLRNAAALALFGWQGAVKGAEALSKGTALGDGSPHLSCCHCGAAYKLPSAARSSAAGVTADRTGRSQHTLAPEKALSADSGSGVDAGAPRGFMAAARRALVAASRAFSSFRNPHGAQGASGTGASEQLAVAPLTADPPEPLLDSHHWYCPVTRSSTVLPPRLAPLAARLSDAASALRGSLKPLSAPEAPQRPPTLLSKDTARDAARALRREQEDALRRAVIAGLSSLSTSVLAVVDEGSLAGLAPRVPASLGAPSHAALSRDWHLTESDMIHGDDEQSACPQTLSRIPGWLFTVLAVLHAAEVCSTASGGEVLPF